MQRDGTLVWLVAYWHLQDHFHLLNGINSRPIAAAIVVGRNPLATRLPQLVVAIFLFETGCGGRERRYPVRLFVLSLSARASQSAK